MQQALKLQGKRGKTIDGYARAVGRIAGYFDRSPNDIGVTELNGYFSALLECSSWSRLKVGLWGLYFRYRHVLGRPMARVH